LEGRRAVEAPEGREVVSMIEQRNVTMGGRKIANYTQFESVEDYLSHLESGRISKANERSRYRGLWEDGPPPRGGTSLEWYGGVWGINAMARLVRGGWRDGAAMLRRAISTIEVPTIQSIVKRPTWASEGDDVDVSRVYGGDLDRAWRSTRRGLTSGTSRNVRILVPLAANCNVSAKNYSWRGGAACVLADALEDAGYRVEIVGFVQTSNLFANNRLKYHSIVLTVKFKSLDEPLEVERIAAMAHPGFFRVLTFAKFLMEPNECEDSLGSTIYGDPVLEREDGDVVIGDVFSAQDAEQFLSRYMRLRDE